MAATTEISWCDATFNPVEGCTKVSEGCKNCYAEDRAERWQTVIWGPQGTRRLAAESYWKQPLKWNKAAQVAGERRKVFCASLADWLEDFKGGVQTTQKQTWWVNRNTGIWELDDHSATFPCRGVPLTLDHVRARLLSLIQRTPHLDWLLLSKRVGDWQARLEAVAALPAESAQTQEVREGAELAQRWVQDGVCLPNIWLGASVENQEWADKRVPALLSIPAPIRFLSCEPLLGPVDLTVYLHEHSLGIDANFQTTNAVDWLIVGGESGRNRRPSEVDWYEAIRKQCQEAGVACFVKQDTALYPGQQGRLPLELFEIKEFPA